MKKALGYFIFCLPLIILSAAIIIYAGWKALLMIIGVGLVAAVPIWGCACLGHYLITGNWTPGGKEKKKDE